MNTDTEQTQHELLTDEQVAVIRGVAERLANGAGMWLYAGALPLASVHVPALLADRAALVRRAEVLEQALYSATYSPSFHDWAEAFGAALKDGEAGHQVPTAVRAITEAEVPPCAD